VSNKASNAAKNMTSSAANSTLQGVPPDRTAGIMKYKFSGSLHDEVPEVGKMSAVKAARLVSTLTIRERQVLIVIENGFSSKQAGEKLYVSKRTIDFHLANIFKKLRVSNRMQMINVARKAAFFG
jgi:DNA-binding NarL/FixJ family response regulator